MTICVAKHRFLSRQTILVIWQQKMDMIFALDMDRFPGMIQGTYVIQNGLVSEVVNSIELFISYSELREEKV